MFESDSDKGETGGFTINKKFAEKYEFNQKRMEKDNLMQKYGNDALNEDEYDSESSEFSEDVDAKLVTSKTENKFNDLILRIRAGDKSLLE